MKAIIVEKYGSSDVLKLKEIEKPIPKDDEVLIKVCASSINSADHRTMRAKPFFVRFMGIGLLRPKLPIPGIDIAGVVEAVGKSITQFVVGDEVYGDIYSEGTGAFVEYICVSENANLVTKPKNISFEQAAAAPVAGITALQALRNHGKIKSGDNVLINGASGGVGTFAVIIAKAFGAQVTGVCSTSNLKLIQSIGADNVIDYTKQDFTQLGKRYDLIIDVAATIKPKQYLHLLKAQGRGVLVGFSTTSHMLSTIRAGKKTAKQKDISIIPMGSATADKKDFIELKALMEEGKITPVIDKTYSLEKASEAMRYFDEEHARAKVIITMCK